MVKHTRNKGDQAGLTPGGICLLGMQHVFAMFGATILVPLLTGFNVSVTLFCAGTSTIAFHALTKRKVPVFLGSSFAFLAAYSAILSDQRIRLLAASEGISPMCYVAGGVMAAGITYMVFAGLARLMGKFGVSRLFPPIVTAPVIILIGLSLSPSAVESLIGDGDALTILVGAIPIIIMVLASVKGKGIVRLVPILLALAAGYAAASAITLCGIKRMIDFGVLNGKPAIGFPPLAAFSPFQTAKGIFAFDASAIMTCCIIALTAVIEHIGDMAAISQTCGEDFLSEPGLSKTLLGDGIGTALAGCLGGPANTTYSENTGVIALTGIKDPIVVEIAACVSILLSFSPWLDGIISTIPACIIGGISFVLYGMISAVGMKSLASSGTDFSDMRNILIMAIILVSGLGFNAHPINIGSLRIGGLSAAAILGTTMNLLMPEGKRTE